MGREGPRTAQDLLQHLNVHSLRNFSYIIIAEVTSMDYLLELILKAAKNIFSKETQPKQHTHAGTFSFFKLAYKTEYKQNCIKLC